MGRGPVTVALDDGLRPDDFHSSYGGLAQQVQEALVAKEDVLPPITAGGEVVEGTAEFQSRRTNRGQTLEGIGYQAKI